jgi:hypothetical protein
MAGNRGLNLLTLTDFGYRVGHDDFVIHPKAMKAHVCRITDTHVVVCLIRDLCHGDQH